MSALTLTFSGSYLELLGWVLISGIYLALAFAAGWFLRGLREDES